MDSDWSNHKGQGNRIRPRVKRRSRRYADSMFLRDAELVERLSQPDPIITGIELGAGAERYSTDAPVQPSSVDLRIGEIFTPGAKAEEAGSAAHPLRGDVLAPGHTAVITTLEEFNFPDEIGAIGFPPNAVSSQGILMTNPGHVDPGYKGNMSFTVINMGSKPYTLQKKEKIVTLLLFKLDAPAEKSWRRRHPDGPSSPPDGVSKLLAVLSRDFMDISGRVKKAAREEEGFTRRVAYLAPIGIGAVGVFLSFFGPLKGEIDELKARAEVSGNVQALQKRVRRLEREATHGGRAQLLASPESRGE